MSNTFYLKSMGCKSNQFEGFVIREHLIKEGFREVKDIRDIGDVDFYILNSCSVTQKSENESLYFLRNAKHLNSNIKTVLTGCVAQLEKKELLKLPYIDFIFGNDDKFKISELIKQGKLYEVTNLCELNNFNYQVLEDTSKTRFSLKIQDGCDSRCSYCVIPYARGHSRSADSEFIINSINKASDNGFKEVVFTGIHIGQWGIENGKNLLDLLREVDEKTKIERYRLGSLNPSEITDELLNFLKNSEKFCPHFHLSLQSACNKTLKSMNRFYRVEDYLSQIEDITTMFEEPFIGSDIIAGFPGETEEDFQVTVANLKKSKLSKIHTFPYSIRKGTEAEKMSGHLLDIVKQKRADMIKEISAEKYEEFLNLNVGSIQEVLIEKHPDKRTHRLKGMTRNYLNIIIEDEGIQDKSDYFNTLRNVILRHVEDGHFIGEIVS